MYEAADRLALADELAGAFLSSPWTIESLAESGTACLDRWPDWMTALAMHVLAVHRSAPAARPGLAADIAGFLAEHPAPPGDREPPAIVRLVAGAGVAVAIRPRGALPAKPPPDLTRWQLPAIGGSAELAERLELSGGQLEWLADVRGLERTVASERLRNYRYRPLPRRGDLPRVIEAPKARLKEIQRWILREILDHVPAHDAAHGFIAGRSAVSHAELHTGRPVVLRLDLKDFFASVPAGRVYRIWRTLGYGADVAHALTGLTTNTVPAAVWQQLAGAAAEQPVQARFWMGRRLATPHLPQGAPTSPALANLAAFRLDRRLAGLAQASGLRYSRYADDLAFSGSERLIRRRAEFEAAVAAIVGAEGFTLNPAKSTTQSAAGRQQVCGVVVNVRTNLRRTDYDTLRATLHNAARHGPQGQNRDLVPDFRAHLLGRISWAEALHPARGRKLRELFAQIDWS